MKVFLVGVVDAESNSVVSIHKTYDGALRAWNKERIELIKLYKRIKFSDVARGWRHEYDSYENTQLNNLSNENPKTMNNYPHDTSYIIEFELEE